MATVETRGVMDAPVGSAMHRGVLVCGRDEPLSRVAELMAEHRVHCIVVSDEPDRASSVWGVVSDLDVVAAATVRPLEEQTVASAAATEAVQVSPSDSLRRAGQLMTEHGVSHLVVVAADGMPVGVISTLDIAIALVTVEEAIAHRAPVSEGA
jgi:CBS domain-containing protein